MKRKTMQMVDLGGDFRRHKDVVARGREESLQITTVWLYEDEGRYESSPVVRSLNVIGNLPVPPSPPGSYGTVGTMKKMADGRRYICTRFTVLH